MALNDNNPARKMFQFNPKNSFDKHVDKYIVNITSRNVGHQTKTMDKNVG